MSTNLKEYELGKWRCSLGQTWYYIEDQSGNTVKISRTDAHGCQFNLYIPRELILAYAKSKVRTFLDGKVRKILQDFLDLGSCP